MLGITLIRSDQNKSRYFEQGKITIGSAASADLRLEHPSVQPEHAMIQVTEGVAVIQRAHRHASLAINGAAVTGVNILSDAQRLRLGDIELVVQLDDPEAATRQSFDRDAVMAVLKRKQSGAGTSSSSASASSAAPDAPTTESRSPSRQSVPKRQSPVRQKPQPSSTPAPDRETGRQVHRQAPRRTTSSAGSPKQRPASTPGAQINRPARAPREESPTSEPQESVAEVATNIVGGAELDRIAAKVAAERKFPVGQGTRPKKEVETHEELPETSDAFEPYRPIESDEVDPEIVNTQRLAVNELASAFASWTNPKSQPEEKPSKEAPIPAPAASDPEEASEAPTSMLSAQTAFPTGIPRSDEPAPVELPSVEPSPFDPLELGEASELNTQELSSQQVASLYMLYKKRKAQKKSEEKPPVEKESATPEPVEADESDEEFSLQNILLEGPQAFGVKTWEEVAAEAAEFQEPEAHYGENRLVGMMSSDDEDSKQRMMILGAIALAVVAFTILLLMTPNSPTVIGEKSDKIEDLDITGMTHFEHRERETRCFTEAECKAMAEQELAIAKKEWEDRDAHYDNRFRAFEHADRARVMLENQGMAPSAVEGLQPIWEEIRNELDTIYKGLRVSFYVAMSRKRYEDAFNVIQLTKMFFPSPRSREFRWAEHLRLALKEKGVEAVVNHKRAVRGRWN